jgi:hypothetical protein
VGAAVDVGSAAAACGVRRVSPRKEKDVSETVLVGRGSNIIEVSRRDWEEELRSAPEGIGKRLEHRSANPQIDGIYLTLEQSCHSTRIVQGALFAFEHAR